MKVIDGQEVATRQDLCKLRNEFHPGERIKFETLVYRTSTVQSRVRVTGTVMGVYSNGIQVGFWYRNWKDMLWLVRWLSYKDIMEAKMSGKLPFSSCGSAKTMVGEE